MGGYGSGRRGTRATMEECLSVDANFYARRGMFKPGGKWGISRWSRGDHETGSCGVLTMIDENQAVCVFQYNDRKKAVNLSAYVPGFGGKRYFFLCPVCGRRMRTLHFRGEEIACRICHGLTYTSCNESHKFDSLFMRMARGDKRFSWQDYERFFKFQVRMVRKEPKKPRGRPRKETE